MNEPSQSAPRAQSAIASAEVPQTELLRLLAARGSVRGYKSDPVPDAWVEAILAAGQRAPTSSNMQAYSVIVVKHPETKARLAEFAGNQRHIMECPVFFALCADQTRIAHASEMHGLEFIGHTLEKGLVATIDASLVGMTMSLVADSLGLGTVMIGAMRNKPLEVAKLLKLPPRVFVVFGLCLGWATEAPQPKPRLPLEAIVHRESWDGTGQEQHLADYDALLQAHYTGQGRATPTHAYTQTTAEKYALAVRMKLRDELKELGWPLE